ncbi:MAG TPA: mycothiol synthase [Actinophytocola sp.]|uniref:mycothiol synthase n=1 Tax=Actinophytocola sp. TaxID=1872138 RepID=UPI002DDD9858|nr:mycothiol synthase [Actinophytocola sp.]HEV2781382.1 mycothiol synthase [Actinophytocola sp.]
MVEVTWQDRLSDDDVQTIRGLLLAARDRDGRPEVDPTGGLPRPLRGGSHALARAGGRLVGYAHLDTKGDAHGRVVAELFVHPDHRRAGIGSALVDSVIGRAPADRLRIWSHGDHPGAARLAEKFGFVRVRELLKMCLDFEASNAPRLPVPTWPPGVRVRTFVTGQDEPDVVHVNRRAFDWHPEQGALTVDDLAAAEDEPWFDPDGFFLAIDPEDRLLGFHWTKVHQQRPPVGEVYVVGVDPEAQGMGLGKALTLAGLHHLHRCGLSKVILYVESDNTAALAVYTHLGFTTVETDVQYELPPAEGI